MGCLRPIKQLVLQLFCSSKEETRMEISYPTNFKHEDGYLKGATHDELHSMREASTLQGDRVPHGQPLLKGQAKYSQRRQSRAERVRLQTHRLSLNLFGFGTSDLYTDLEEVSRAINGSTKDGLAVSETKSNFQGSRDSVALTSHGE